MCHLSVYNYEFSSGFVENIRRNADNKEDDNFMKRHRCVKKCSCRQQDREKIMGYRTSYTALQYSRVPVLIKGTNIHYVQ